MVRRERRWFGPNWLGIGSGWATATPVSWEGFCVAAFYIAVLSASSAVAKRHVWVSTIGIVFAFATFPLVVKATFAKPSSVDG